MNRNTQLQKQAGFTLVEIMVVVVILGLLASAGAVAYMKSQEDAKVGIAKSKCSSLQNDIENFIIVDPSRLDISPDDLFERMAEEKYLKNRSDIRDPWGEEYRVTKDEDGDFIVYSKGKDRQQVAKQETTPDDKI